MFTAWTSIEVFLGVFLGVIWFASTAEPGMVNVVSIVDSSSVVSTLIKLYSIRAGMRNPQRLQVLILYMGSSSTLLGELQTTMTTCFPSLKSRIQVWQPPAHISLLRNSSFEQPHIYARFYLPTIFPDIDKFIYLDNDLIVTMDIEELFDYPMELLPSHAVKAAPPSSRIKSSRPLPSKLDASRPHHRAVVALVVEDHPHYKGYLTSHFNQSDTLVQQAMKSFGESTFLNGGVIVVDALQWRRLQYTRKVEKLMERNLVDGIYDASVGDQGPYYLLFHDSIIHLPANYNMRRLPKKTMLMLDKGAVGIVHFAGITHGDEQFLCKYPLLHEILFRAALPLYLSIVHSFSRQCRLEVVRNFTSVCDKASQQLKDQLQISNISPHFYSGRGAFQWPIT